VSWDSRFAEPIVLEDGVKLASLRQAIAHLVKTVPAAERGSPAVLTAAELLTNAAEHGGAVEFCPYRHPQPPGQTGRLTLSCRTSWLAQLPRRVE
jgi:hypothetical protein